MQDDLIFRITSFLPYPWVSRMDRTIYQQYPQLDPVKMLRKCIFASLTGYWIANLKGWNRYYSAIFATCPLLAKFLWDEWTLSKTLTPYGTIDFKGTAKLSIKSHYPLLD